ncbi:hypothetical protein PsorP6_008658 [Peronosclerospora sorghi]|uniref:Uncharacterized protein n=1 Tax=Peronosclerospora sorghi TaxID=230839 RepID=A0ACC0WD24_9STRA|nr:hypothetical protein PsorP6_008658 [Peronosclerospora sorghi]
MAIGKDAVSAKTFLERRYDDDLEMEDAIHTALLTLGKDLKDREGGLMMMGDGVSHTMDETNIEVGIIKDDKNFHIITPAEEYWPNFPSSIFPSKKSSPVFLYLSDMLHKLLTYKHKRCRGASSFFLGIILVYIRISSDQT